MLNTKVTVYAIGNTVFYTFLLLTQSCFAHQTLHGRNDGKRAFISSYSATKTMPMLNFSSVENNSETPKLGYYSFYNILIPSLAKTIPHDYT